MLRWRSGPADRPVLECRPQDDIDGRRSRGLCDEVARKLRALARQSAERAVEIAPDLADAHIALGWFVLAGALDFARAAPEIERALVLSPGNAFVQSYYASFQSFLGHHEKAESSEA